ncbi:hypothetical protein OOJ91_11985 [Micromonospora lupini]|uniref:HNH endonuclease n=1 Tax=Micromonospora lupini TaxID=285679 RepID=UPI00224E3E20|nr:hypothetical protein [Micromonospora lupini]MCX5066597.1 hypothetical protein [Micromonospora lupini]
MKRSGPITRSAPLNQVSKKKLAALAAAGERLPFSTLVNRPAPSGTSGDRDRKPAARFAKPADTDPTIETVQVVAERDQGRCVRCGKHLSGERGLDWSVQHRRARGSGGTSRPDTNEPQNLILLCGSATSPGGCHLAVESSKRAARPHGWAIWLPEDPARVPVDHYLHGRVWLDADGGWTDQEPAEAS